MGARSGRGVSTVAKVSSSKGTLVRGEENSVMMLGGQGALALPGQRVTTATELVLLLLAAAPSWWPGFRFLR